MEPIDVYGYIARGGGGHLNVKGVSGSSKKSHN